MIVTIIINLLLALPTFLLSLLPDNVVTLPDNVFNIMHEVFYGIGYVLPMAGLASIMVISTALIGMQITWSIILRIKSFIPTMGA